MILARSPSDLAGHDAVACKPLHLHHIEGIGVYSMTLRVSPFILK